MGGAVGAHDGFPADGIHAGVHGVADAEHTGNHGAVVQHLAGFVLLHVPHLKDGVLEDQQTVVGALAAHLGVEGGLVQHDLRLGAGRDLLLQLALGNDRQNAAVVMEMVVAGEFGGSVVQPQIQARPGGFVLAAGPGLLPLLFHQRLEGILIHAHPLVGGHFLGQIQGEAVGVMELEGVGAGKHALALFLVLSQHAGEDGKAAVDRAGEVLLFGADHTGDILLPLGKLGISVLVFVNDGITDFVKEGFLNTKETAVACGPAEQSAKHVAPTLVGGQHPVADHEGGGTDVIGDDAQGNVLVIGFAVMGAGDLGNLMGDVHHRVHVEEGVHVLAHHGQTLQTHAGVDVFLAELGIVALSVVVELGEDDIPDLDIPVALAAHVAVRLAAAVLFATVVVDLGAGAARPAAVLPEVVLLAEAVDPIAGDADLIVPDMPGLVVRRGGLVAGKHGGIQPVGVQPHPFRGGQKLPRPVDGFPLEVVAEGKVAQHLKISAVAGGLADVLNVGSADALLTGGDTTARRLLLPGEPGLHGAHAGVDKKKRRVVLRDQREAGKTQMAFTLKKAQVHFTQLIESVLFQFLYLQTKKHPAP